MPSGERSRGIANGGDLWATKSAELWEMSTGSMDEDVVPLVLCVILPTVSREVVNN